MLMALSRTVNSEGGYNIPSVFGWVVSVCFVLLVRDLTLGCGVTEGKVRVKAQRVETRKGLYHQFPEVLHPTSQ